MGKGQGERMILAQACAVMRFRREVVVVAIFSDSQAVLRRELIFSSVLSDLHIPIYSATVLNFIHDG